MPYILCQLKHRTCHFDIKNQEDTMKKIYLLRHANAAFSLNDKEREITKEGKQEIASLKEQIFKVEDFQPDLILCSDAKRTKQTLALLWEGQSKSLIQYSSTLYSAGTTIICKEVEAVSESVEQLLLVGHNPSVSEICSHLLNKSVGLSTANLVCFEARKELESWTEWFSKEWRFKQVYKP